ncbi:hypothetical protein Taro_047969 [Colocasia esculenta]|uniref:Uncharacterized protein n=1 Tax=Colocasia esculenta TaxID=4460 RepID=A0A843WUF6_COLES|nr:hypothetical protein [Colocasia esculenta]
MNCVELDSYIEEFDSVILQRNPRLTNVQVEKEREKSFATWLRSRRYGTWKTEWEGFHLRRPRVYADRVRLPVYAGRPDDRDRLPVHAGHPVDRDRLPVHAGRPSDRDRLPVHAGRPANRDRLPDPASSVTFPIPVTTRGKIDLGSASCYITTLVHAHIPGPMDSWKEFPLSVRELLFDMFTKVYVGGPGQGNEDHRQLGSYGLDDYDPVWLRRDYWESLCHRWATGPWQERSQAVERNRATHPEKNLHTSGSVSYAAHSKKLRHELERAPTFRELFDRTHKRKGTDDYVSESARTIIETYDRTMIDRYAEGTPQPDLDPEA